MTGPAEPRGDCSENIDPTRLIRHGTSQADRAEVATLAAGAPVDERRPEHAIVFASAYARYLRYADFDGTTTTDWKVFFASDLSAQLAVPAVEDVARYRTTVTALLRELENPVAPDATSMVRALGAVFDCLGTLALRLDDLATTLPPAHRLRATIANLVRSQLGAMLRRLIGCHRAGLARGVVDTTEPPPGDLLILGMPVRPFWRVTTIGLSAPEWTAGSGVADWAAYLDVDPTDFTGAYGDGTVVEQVNHLATHNLFTEACEAFLAAHARVVDESRAALEESFTDPGHAPHYALFMAFLRLFEHARTEMNTLTGKHLMFYYRNVLGLGQQPAEPSHAHLLVQLAKHVERHLIAEGTLLKAGKDAQGTDAYFVTDRDLVANKGAVAELKSLYRHPADGPLPADRGRIFACPAVDTESGASWHPFVEEVLTDGQVASIDMPPAQVGFAIASHHLWMAEGKRTVHVSLATNPASKEAFTKLDLLCRLTTTKGWIDKRVDSLSVDQVGRLVLEIDLAGGDPPVTPYDAATHGYSFATSLPVLLVLLAHEDQHQNTVPWDYPRLVDKDLVDVTVRVDVKGLKSVTLSNDQGPVDGSKPFLAYGSTPTANSSLVIGSKEVFQKGPSSLRVDGTWMSTPKPSSTTPKVTVQFLANGTWTTPADLGEAVVEPHYTLTGIPSAQPGSPDLTPDAPYATTSRAGFLRLALTDGFGTATYPGALASWIVTPTGDPPEPPVLPMLQSLTLAYTAEQKLALEQPSEAGGRFYHVAPFGHAEQTKAPTATSVPLLPRFLAGSQPAEGELYIGVAGLEPPQHLALLVQVVDGTANPLVVKPDDHITWTYLRGDDWVPLDAAAVADGTDGLLVSGIVTIAVPADATTDHTLLPEGRRWIRLAVASRSDAVCRLLTVAAQALKATYAVSDPGADAQSGVLPPGTVNKLATPDASVKSIDQPFPTFGGRAKETDAAFTVRVSERLRHRDRLIALWDYEHLVLEAFPSIYQARCLNHTQYDPTANGTGIYRELAPGHVTVVTIPDLAMPNPRDPLRPSTSLHVLDEVEKFLAPRMSCFVRLHVRNPQFEQVRVELRVRLRDGFDETYHLNELRREITEFLSPWAYRGDARPTFDGTVHKSALVNFVDERRYVDYVTDVHLYRHLPGAGTDGPDLDEVVGSRAISILVSMPPDAHRIQPIHSHDGPEPDGCSCSEVGV